LKLNQKWAEKVEDETEWGSLFRELLWQYSGRSKVGQTSKKEFKIMIQELEKQIQQLIQYMNVKISQRDWHGVADAAMDIRELEAKIQVYRNLIEHSALLNDLKEEVTNANP
jgi:hypothetical protein